MYCPSCGSEERQASQYCRACGTDLRPVRIGLGLLLNALVFTRPGKRLQDNSADARAQNLLDTGAPPQLRAGREAQAPPRVNTTSNLVQPGSVTEHTTLHLKSDR